MKSRSALIVLLGAALMASGCGKKTADQASLSGTGFDALSNTSELASLPQASLTGNQQSSVEMLPIEASPVTQSTPVAANLPIMGLAEAVNTEALSYQQKIQTALKNAGFYNGAIDGKIGPASRKAIEAFQQQNGLKVDGKVGPKTWAVLESYLSGSQSS